MKTGIKIFVTISTGRGLLILLNLTKTSALPSDAAKPLRQKKAGSGEAVESLNIAVGLNHRTDGDQDDRKKQKNLDVLQEEHDRTKSQHQREQYKTMQRPTRDDNREIPNETEDQSISDVTQTLNGYAQTIKRDLKFISQDDVSKVEVYDRETGELIRRIPEQLARDMSGNLDDFKDFHLLETRA